MLQKQAYVFPFWGGRKVEYLQSAVDVLNIVLTVEEGDEIMAANPV